MYASHLLITGNADKCMTESIISTIQKRQNNLATTFRPSQFDKLQLK
jgi:hypothetical protein